MQPSIIKVEQMTIPTYPVMPAETMPMFAENRGHQGTTGRPYPVLPVLNVVRDNCADRSYEVIRLENDYIRLIIIPELGGRIFEAYDKINHYDFLYRQHVIKPSLIGAYGLWISGGLEFNWPFHHRPSTYMPVNYTTETQPDGTAIAWLSECDPADRTRCTIGIVLRPDAAFFETRISVTNRTPLRHSFLMWQNAAVKVNDDYQFMFPPDVNYVNNHHTLGRPPMTYPIAEGSYSGAYYDEPTDISWYKNCFHATSHFAAPSKYDFFGGYDHGKQCGIIHIANHHVSPGKKMFTWGLGKLSDSWEKALTDEDGRYCELMAGSYSNNQPDFTWLSPYETKCFSEFWYPVGAIGKTSFATLKAAVCVEMAQGVLRVQTTEKQQKLHVRLSTKGGTLLDTTCDTVPCTPVTLSFPAAEGLYTVDVTDAHGVSLLHYSQEILNELNYPEPVTLAPHPDTLKTVQELYLQGVHIDQYRHPQVNPDVYWQEALRREPEHYPSMIALGEYRYRMGFYDEALKLLTRAVKLQHMYNQHDPDGQADYLLGLVLDALGRTDEAYDHLYTAAWSSPSIAKAMCKLAAIDGRRGDYDAMLAHSRTALEAAARHPLAIVYAALAVAKLGDQAQAKNAVALALQYDPLNDLALYVQGVLTGGTPEDFLSRCCSDPSQTALDIAYDLMDAGFDTEAAALLSAVKQPSTPMVNYTRAFIAHRQGQEDIAAACRAKAQKESPRSVYPYRLAELRVLEDAVTDPKDAAARDLLACALYDKHHWQRATGLWEEAVCLRSDCAVYLRNLAVAYSSHGNRREEAVALMAKASSLSPEHQQLLIEYLYAASKADTPAEERLAVIAAHPVKERLRDDYVLEYAKALCVADQYDKAMALMLSHDFMPAEGGEMIINAVYFQIVLHNARKALAEGDPAEAHKLLDHADVLPENLHSGFWRETEVVPLRYYDAVALSQLGRTEEAAAMYQLVLQRFSDVQPDLAFYFAAALRALGKGIDARRFLSRMMRMLDERDQHAAHGWEDSISTFNSFMNDPDAHRKGLTCYWRGLILQYAEAWQEAREQLETSLRLWPDNLPTRVALMFLPKA